MDPSIMKLLEEDEDESMHSGADVEAFSAALNRDIERGKSSTEPSQQKTFFSQEGNQASSQMYSQWQPSNQDDNSANQSHQQDVTNQEQRDVQSSSQVEVKEQGSSIESKQEVNSGQAPTGLQMQFTPMQVDGQGRQLEQNSGNFSQSAAPTQIQISGRAHSQNPEQDRMHNLSNGAQLPNMQRLSSNQAAPEQGGASTQKQKQIPFGSLLPIILPELDKDRAMQLQTLYTKLRRNEIPKDGFVRHMRNIVGDQMLRLAVVKMQAKSQNLTQQQQQPPQQQHHPRPPGTAAQFSDSYSFGPGQKSQSTHPMISPGPPHGPTVAAQPHKDSGHQTIDSRSHGMQSNQMIGRPSIPMQSLTKQQQEHLQFSQSSLPMCLGRFWSCRSNLLMCEAYNYPAASADGRNIIDSFYALPLVDRSFPGVIDRLYTPKRSTDSADQDMSTGNASKKSFSARDYAARASKRMRTPGGVTVLPTPPSSAAVDAVPRRDPVVTRSSERLQTSPTKTTTATSSAPRIAEEFPFVLPHDFGFSPGHSVWPYLSHLKLPDGVPELEGRSLEESLQDSAVQSFKVTQMCLRALEMHGVHERRLLVAEDDNKKLVAKYDEVAVEVDRLKGFSDALDKKLREVQDKEAAGKEMIANLTADLYKKSSQLQEVQQQLAQKKEQVYAAGSWFTFSARIECMEEHAAGKSAEWDLEAERKALEDAFPVKPDFSMPDDEADQDMEDVSSKVSPSTADVEAPNTVEGAPEEKAV